MELCRLCRTNNTSIFYVDDDSNLGKVFFLCNDCKLIFVSIKLLPKPEIEKNRYLSHNNDVEDLGYQTFLSKLWNPMEKRLTKGASGLDYGAGPGPALMQMMSESGYIVQMYDPFFAINEAALNKTYDFIVCTETAEHFHNPSKDFHQLDSMLKRNGFLGVMTSFTDKVQVFGDWYYRRDPTHVSFYSTYTMQWIAEKMNWKVDFIKDNVVIFYKD
jgi:hypothetical protein